MGDDIKATINPDEAPMRQNLAKSFQVASEKETDMPEKPADNNDDPVIIKI